MLPSPDWPSSSPTSLSSFVPETQTLLFLPVTQTLPSPFSSDTPDLPSPSCTTDVEQRLWDLDQYPFDSSSLVSCSVDLSNLFGLEHEEGQGRMKEIITTAAVSMHKKKIKSARSKLEMERKRLGPVSPPPIRAKKM
ncbi:unnamed protein product [Linum trigynum]|uniref:Uncharacterized protein n=1 Tax=Linum trigynum TaxID=586398 RepID=A0AAV2F6A6_9ROSI